LSPPNIEISSDSSILFCTNKNIEAQE